MAEGFWYKGGGRYVDGHLEKDFKLHRFLGFWVSLLQSFKVSEMQRFKGSKAQRFKGSNKWDASEFEVNEA